MNYRIESQDLKPEKFKLKPSFSIDASRIAQTKSVPPSDFPLLPAVLKDALDALSTNGKSTKKSVTALKSLGNHKQRLYRTLVKEPS